MKIGQNGLVAGVRSPNLMKIGQNSLVAGIRSQIVILLRKECLTTDVAALDAGQDLPGSAARLSQLDNLHILP